MKALLTAMILIGCLGSMTYAQAEGARVGMVSKKKKSHKQKRGPASVKKKKKKKKKSKKHQY